MITKEVTDASHNPCHLDPTPLEHLCDLAVTIASPFEVGTMPAGLRRMIPITRGTVTGAQVNCKVLAGGAFLSFCRVL